MIFCACVFSIYFFKSDSLCHINVVLLDCIKQCVSLGGRMRVYWKIKGTRAPLYTTYRVEKIVDKTTLSSYFPGDMVVFKKNEAPKALAENDDRYQLFVKQSEFHIERRGLFKKQKVYTQLPGDAMREEIIGKKGFYVIEGIVPPIYTSKACDIVRDKVTKQEYRRGDMKIWWTEDYPMPLAEHLDKFDFIYFIHEDERPMTQDDYTREIWARGLFRKR